MAVICVDHLRHKKYIGSCYRELSSVSSLSMTYLEKLANGTRKSNDYQVYWDGEKGKKAIPWLGIGELEWEE